MVLPFPEGHTVEIILYVLISDWLIPFSSTHWSFSMSFCGLIAHLFLIFSIFWCMDISQFVDPFTYLKDLVVLNKFGQSLIKLLTWVCLEVWLLHQMVNLYLILWETTRLSSKVYRFSQPPTVNESSHCPHPHWPWGLPAFWIFKKIFFNDIFF